MFEMLFLIAFFLVQNITISGTLKNADGKSISGARIAAIPVGETFFYGSTNTDKDGRFTLELPPCTYYVVTGDMLRPTYYTAFGSKAAISASRDRIQFVVNPGGSALTREIRLSPPPLQMDVPPAPRKLLSPSR